jgi:polysaccharide pyruvyl transferase CsaB
LLFRFFLVIIPLTTQTKRGRNVRILHLIGGGDIGGAKTHVISLLARLSLVCDIKLVSFREGEFAEDCRAAGIDTVAVESISPFAAHSRLMKIAAEFRPDVIHCHGARANMMGVWLKHSLRLPAVTTIHSDYRLDYLGNARKQATFGLINRACLRFIDYYTCVADRTARMMITRGFAPSRVFTIYNGIDFAPASTVAKRATDGEVTVGIAARLTAVKDVQTLIRACKAALSRGAKLRLLIAGDGEDRQSLEALARELDIKDRVTFTGWLSDTREFFRSIDINVLCSLSETFPYVVLEGIDAGCTTISSDVGGMPELIDSGENGFIFAPRDWETLGDQLYTLAENAALRREFAAKLRAKAERYFSLDRMAATQYGIYESVLRRHEFKKRRAGVLICGAYGKGNAGDDAILRAIVNEMRSIDRDMPLTVMSRRPRMTELDYRADSIFTFNIQKMHALLRRAALYINGGGSLIQNVTSNRSLYFYLYTLRAARKRGAGVMMYGCGIGPVVTDAKRRLAANVLNRDVDVITLREDDSRDELSRMGVTAPRIAMAADPALTLDPASDAAVDAAFNAAGIPPHGDYLCLCVRNWKNFAAAVPAIAKAADYAKEKLGLDIVLLPIEMPADESAGDALAAAMNSTPYIFRRRFDTETTIGIIARMHGVLSMRLHALVFAARMGVPSAGIVYDQKVDGFMRYMRTELFVDLDKVTADVLCGFVDAMQDSDRENLMANAARLRELENVNVVEARKIIGEAR